MVGIRSGFSSAWNYVSNNPGKFVVVSSITVLSCAPALYHVAPLVTGLATEGYFGVAKIISEIPTNIISGDLQTILNITYCGLSLARVVSKVTPKSEEEEEEDDMGFGLFDDEVRTKPTVKTLHYGRLIKPILWLGGLFAINVLSNPASFKKFYPL